MVVAIGIAQQNEIGFLGDVNPFRRKFETDRQMKFIGENDFLVGATIAIGILVNEDLVVRHRIAGTVSRVGGHGGDPQASLIIEGELHRIGEVGKFFFRCEQFHLILLRNG